VSIPSVFTNEVINKFHNTGNYEPFDGSSIQAGEGRWYGYRHSDKGEVIMLYGLGFYYAQILDGGAQIVVWAII
jgi:hypothetical protein